jgi:hypothetical protein
MKLVHITLLGALLAGCSSPIIVMKNPDTGEIAQCRGSDQASFFPIAQAMTNKSMVDSCTQGYEAAGWKRMN